MEALALWEISVSCINILSFTIKVTFYGSILAKATYAAIAKTYAYLTPDLWTETVFNNSPYQEHSDYLMKNHRPIGTQRQEAKAY